MWRTPWSACRCAAGCGFGASTRPIGRIQRRARDLVALVSFLALDLCVAVASQTSFAASFVLRERGRVTLLCAEDPDAVVVERLESLARARTLRLADLPIDVIVERGVRLPDAISRLAATVAATEPALLLLDPLIRLHRADENSAAEMSVILDGLRDLARSSGTAVLLSITHARPSAPRPVPRSAAAAI